MTKIFKTYIADTAVDVHYKEDYTIEAIYAGNRLLIKTRTDELDRQIVELIKNDASASINAAVVNTTINNSVSY